MGRKLDESRAAGGPRTEGDLRLPGHGVDRPSLADTHETGADVAWIRDLAGEWSERWSRSRDGLHHLEP